MAVRGSKAAVCSSRRSNEGPLQDGHEKGQRLPLAAGEEADAGVEAIFQAESELASRPENGSPFVALTRDPSLRRLPRAAAIARFSSMVMLPAVPMSGS